MIRVQEVTALYRIYINSGRDRNAWEAYSEITRTFIMERRDNGQTIEQIANELFNATWYVENRAYTTTTIFSSGITTSFQSRTTNTNLEENRRNFHQEIEDVVRSTLRAGNSAALGMS